MNLATDILDYGIYKNSTRNMTIKTLADSASDHILILIECGP